MDYPELKLFIGGEWLDAGARETGSVLNPATGKEIGRVPFATKADLDRALQAAESAFGVWRSTSPYERSRILRAAAARVRERCEEIATLITLEQGKPLAESRAEVHFTADIVDWCAEEGRRAYGRVIAARAEGVRQMVSKEPVGPVAGFSPWNAPALSFGRKFAEALAAGCSCIMKPAEETPATALAIVRAFADAGLPPGVLNIVFGVPAEVSTYLIRSPVIRKVSLTGSVEAGRSVGALAGERVKPITLELGGHGPVLVFEDSDPERVAELSVAAKFRNAGQSCGAPTRFLVHESLHDRFLAHFARCAAALKVGDGFAPETQMGPLANVRRLAAMERIVGDARERGARLACGGKRRGDSGFFWEPTVLSRVPLQSEMMTREPFGPIAAVAPFARAEDAVREANRLPYGLVAYAFTRSRDIAAQLGRTLEAGVIGINTFSVVIPETPFGGVKESGHGAEGGMEGVSAYLVSKYVAETDAV